MSTQRPPSSTALILVITAFVAAAALAACGGDSNPAQPSPAACTFTLSPQQHSFSSDGGTGTVAVATSAQCAWTVDGASDWVTVLAGASGTGPGNVSLKVLGNPDQAARERTLTIATNAFKVTQDGRSCSYTIAPEQRTIDDDGGTGDVQVMTTEGCSWTARSNDTWITVTAGAEGRGPGTAKYSASVNRSTSSRTGTVTVAGRTHTVKQDGENPPPPADCQYAVDPVAFSPCMPGGTLTARITTQAACTWTAAPGASWLSIPAGSSGSGNGTVTIKYSDNYDAPREGTVMVRWPAPTQGQNIHVAQAGCLYAVSTSTIAFAAAGGTGRFDVIQQSVPNSCGGATQDACPWTAVSSVPWIVVTTSMPQLGDDPVSFTVAANTGAARTGTIKVRDKEVTITQAAP